MARHRDRHPQDQGRLRLHGRALNDALFAVLAACRALHAGAAMTLFGAGAVLYGAVPPRLAAAVEGALRPWLNAAVAALAVTAAAIPALTAGRMGEGWADAVDPAMLGTLLLDTGFGRAWLGHAALVALFVAMFATKRRESGRANGWPSTAVAALVLASLGLSGHAATHAGPLGVLLRVNEAAHLLSAGAWVGGVAPLLIIMRRADDPAVRAEAVVALRRFSRAGHAVVALVLATGALNTVLVLGRVPADLRSPYEAVLLGKIALALGMTALAVHNRYRLVPHLPDAPAPGLARLRFNTAAILALGWGAVLASGELGLLDPGREP